MKGEEEKEGVGTGKEFQSSSLLCPSLGVALFQTAEDLSNCCGLCNPNFKLHQSVANSSVNGPSNFVNCESYEKTRNLE